jgi:outer membrane protein OmpA-like peptidoglycan-associated protein
VKKWLVTRGKIDGARLESKGFGMDQPIDTNDTDAGRQKNRRVAFKIVDKKPTAPKPAP